MSSKWYQDIKDLMKLYGQEVKGKPEIPKDDVVLLRQALCIEEFNEMMTALGLDAYFDIDNSKVVFNRDPARKIDLVGLADGAIDLFVVVLGTLAAFGIDPEPLWQIVHENNLSKANGPVREDGKKLKPEGWTPPDVLGELRRQGYEPN